MTFLILAQVERANDNDRIQPPTSPALMLANVRVPQRDNTYPYNVFDFTLNRGRDGPKYFLKDYRRVLLADAYGGYNGVVAGNEITRTGCWAHLRRKVIDAEKAAPEIAREAIDLVRALYAVERQARDLSLMARLELRQEESMPVLAQLRKKLLEWKSNCCQSIPWPKRLTTLGTVGRTESLLCGWCGQHRQQRLGTRDEACDFKSKEFFVCRQSAWR
jgi:Transposase IS66 family